MQVHRGDERHLGFGKVRAVGLRRKHPCHDQTAREGKATRRLCRNEGRVTRAASRVTCAEYLSTVFNTLHVYSAPTVASPLALANLEPTCVRCLAMIGSLFGPGCESLGPSSLVDTGIVHTLPAPAPRTPHYISGAVSSWHSACIDSHSPLAPHLSVRQALLVRPLAPHRGGRPSAASSTCTSVH